MRFRFGDTEYDWRRHEDMVQWTNATGVSELDTPRGLMGRWRGQAIGLSNQRATAFILHGQFFGGTVLSADLEISAPNLNDLMAGLTVFHQCEDGTRAIGQHEAEHAATP